MGSGSGSDSGFGGGVDVEEAEEDGDEGEGEMKGSAVGDVVGGCGIEGDVEAYVRVKS